MENNNEIMSVNNAQLLENVLVNGDLAKLTAPQRLDYYRQVCQSMGLNPLSKPFDYINLNGKLTLYAKKDATDQLRKIHGVSIDDVQQDFEGDLIIVTVKGSDRNGRKDVEVGVVGKNEMRGNVGNAMMKAVTKAKRRLTLSLCGLGWLDETEIETIPEAKPVIVSDTGEIIEAQVKPQPQQKRAATPEEWEKWLIEKYSVPQGVMQMAYNNAKGYTTDNGTLYDDMEISELWGHYMGLKKKSVNPELSEDQKDGIKMKMSAICSILWRRKEDKRLAQNGES